jgi:hypothetical protein
VATVALNASSGQFDIPNILPGFYDLYARSMTRTPCVWQVEVDVANQDVTGLAERALLRQRGRIRDDCNSRSRLRPPNHGALPEPVGACEAGIGLRAGPVGARISNIRMGLTILRGFLRVTIV